MYIGCHKTLNPEDDYIGSGTILKRAIKKYGIENFKKEVLFVFDTPEEMFVKEMEIVDKLFIESENTYNLLIGGRGGFGYINSTGKNLYDGIGDGTHGKQNLLNGYQLKKMLTKQKRWDDWKNKVSLSVKKIFSEKGHPWLGRKHKESSKKKIGKKLSVVQRGKNNSQYGTCWIYLDKEKINKRIKKEELKNYLETGWYKGRKMQFNPSLAYVVTASV